MRRDARALQDMVKPTDEGVYIGHSQLRAVLEPQHDETAGPPYKSVVVWWAPHLKMWWRDGSPLLQVWWCDAPLLKVWCVVVPPFLKRGGVVGPLSLSVVVWCPPSFSKCGGVVVPPS